MNQSDLTGTTRRDFLRLAGAAGGALVLGACWQTSAARTRMEGKPGVAASVPLTAWVRIAPSGSVTLIASQSEMGQGITTTLAAALAHELYLPFESVSIEFAPFQPEYRDPVYHWMFTGNSQGTSSFYDIMRRMGAAAREMLFNAAADRLGVPASSLSTHAGLIHDAATQRTIAFADVATVASALPVPEKPVLREDVPFPGRSLARWDIPAKVDGSAIFGIDVHVSDMLLAAVRCAPRFGARLTKFDETSIRAQPGVVAVVEVPHGLAVVAKTYWQARRTIDAAHLEWSDEGSTLTSSQSLPPAYRQKLASGPFFVHKTVGNVDEADARASRRLEAVYETPFQAHATMEPMNCTAHVTADRCEIWAPTQGMEMAHNVAMHVTGVAPERIVIHRTLLGGGFGRRLHADFLKQALIIAMAVKHPVKLIWSREEDMTHDFYRPGALHQVAGGVDASGALKSLSHRIVSPSHMLYIVPRAYFPTLQDWTEPAALPEANDTMAVEGLLDVPYEIPNQHIEQHRLELDVPVSVWRTTGHGPNNFVLEGFVDELAVAAHTDPLAFRLAAIKGNDRARGVLERVREKTAWGSALPAGRGRGLALAHAFGGLIAMVVELSVAESRVKIYRIVAVVDCGRTLDPGIATSNILGGIVWGLSGMKTAISFEDGRTVQSNFSSFQPLSLRETPPCEVHFIESGAKLGGAGELGPVPVHAAVCNAIFAATGTRIRSLPLSNAGLSFA